jgi:hypothetical protein
VPVLSGPLEQQAIAAGSLDVIVANDVVEHLPDPVSTLGRMAALLAPDGLLMLQTPCAPEDASHAQLERAGDSFLKMMEEAKGRFPQGLAYIVALDTTLAVSEGIHEIYKTLGEALILVILVVYIFLQGFRATLIPLLAVPVSLIGTFAVFPMMLELYLHLSLRARLGD